MRFSCDKFIGVTAVAILLIASGTQASFLDKLSVATYWGQNSKDGSNTQKSLSYYCDDNSDVLIMSFVLNFKDGSLPSLNLANSCDGPVFSGTKLLKCTDIGNDIKTCQKKGKTVLMSLGGSDGVYGFKNNADAEAFADTLWNLFGAGSSDTRPFGDAILDGFDLDIEGGGSAGYAAMVKRLRTHFAKDDSRKYFITGAPQCPFPDAMMGTVMDEVAFDAVNVQFYNNYCSTTSGSFNFNAWDTWAKETSPNKDVKILMGLPGSKKSAGSGYVPFNALKPIVEDVYSTYSSFGGIMLWDASTSYANTDVSPNYQVAVADLVHGLEDNSGTTTTTTAKPTKTKSTTTKSTKSTTTKSTKSTTTKSTKSTTTKSTKSTTTKSTKTRTTKSTTKSSKTTKSSITKSTKTTTTKPHTKTSTHDETIKSTKTKSSTTTKSTTRSTKTRSTKTRSTKTRSTKTTNISEPTDTPISCVSSGEPCSTEGKLACVDNSFATCNHGAWVLRSCPSGLTCFSTTDGSSIYCGQGTTNDNNTCATNKKLDTMSSLNKMFKKADGDQVVKSVFVGPAARPYKSSRVIAQFSVASSDTNGFSAVINARRLDQRPFGNTVTVQFKVAENIQITQVENGKVTQTGTQVKIQYRNDKNSTLASVVGIQGEIKSGVFIAPNANSMKFFS